MYHKLFANSLVGFPHVFRRNESQRSTALHDVYIFRFLDFALGIGAISMTTVLLRGGAGFAGSHIADEIGATTDWNVVVLEALTYAGRLDRLAHLPGDPVRVRVRGIRWQD